VDLNGKLILLIIGGGIAAYKSLDLIRRLSERSAKTRVILTAAGGNFVTPLSAASLSRDKVYQDLFDLTDESEMGHITLSRSADLVVVAPATANLMAKLAGGIADDLASTVLLATDKAVLMAPAMNVLMWEHASVRRNLAALKKDGVHFVGPNKGDMACGEFGLGRMAEPDEIVAAIAVVLGAKSPGPLAGMKALVTAGPTHEPLDPVRYLGNRSSGKQGYAIADALGRAGAETTLISGPVGLDAPQAVKLVRVETARQMLAACEAALPTNIAVCTAAVADWRPEIQANSKIKKPIGDDGAGKKSGEAPALSLIENPDILSEISHHASRPQLVIGFAAETEALEAHAREKRERKGCDWIVANDVGASSSVMGGDKNKVHLVTPSRSEAWPELEKTEVARRLAEKIAAFFEKAA
jgi:phosphopantothenoylcysteine decarboxylase/phosphopantothenate--cysteine ligase